MPVDKFGRMSDIKTRDTGVSFTYINNNYICSDGSTPISGSIDMKGNTLNNVSDPINPFFRYTLKTGSSFKIIVIKDTREVSNLLSYDCIYRDHSLIEDSINVKCGFDHDPENIVISEGDVINIRTEKVNEFSDYILSSRNGSFPDLSYLFTFLIELDPL